MLFDVFLLFSISISSIYSFSRYIEVGSKNHMNVVMECLLAKFEDWTAAGPMLRCTAACNSIEQCRFFCIEGKTCMLFNAYVKKIQIHPATRDPDYRERYAYNTSFDVCFSSWHDDNDITHNNFDIVYSSSSDSKLRFSYYPGRNGFFCNKGFESFHTFLPDDNKWWKLDMLTPKIIKEIHLVFPFIEDSKNAKVFFGNSSTVDNNTLIASYPEGGDKRTPLVIPIPGGLSGRFVGITRPSGDYLAISAIKVIEYE